MCKGLAGPNSVGLEIVGTTAVSHYQKEENRHCLAWEWRLGARGRKHWQTGSEAVCRWRRRSARGRGVVVVQKPDQNDSRRNCCQHDMLRQRRQANPVELKAGGWLGGHQKMGKLIPGVVQSGGRIQDTVP